MAEFVGSRLKSQRGRGQSQDQTGSTTKSPLAPIPNVAPPNASADCGSWQTRDLNVKTAKSEHPVPAHSGTKGAAAGARVPDRTEYRKR